MEPTMTCDRTTCTTISNQVAETGCMLTRRMLCARFWGITGVLILHIHVLWVQRQGDWRRGGTRHFLGGAEPMEQQSGSHDP